MNDYVFLVVCFTMHWQFYVLCLHYASERFNVTSFLSNVDLKLNFVLTFDELFEKTLGAECAIGN